ncbi:sulfite exporter TauE/SafE family protein [Photobacterium atrarenae]|uniref:Probable membrane transporter protein n=1 Tax=Photobacterium atrarenae TaxID=865757 RepID=A0ABY5GDD2_9GAMM|nr:sulfite exporter TauE/SafE family protein [Photobacterium atrarenae]UTV26607.1 sulfite exporter TauE/SafE family protein [Photobacterium atrarenae]
MSTETLLILLAIIMVGTYFQTVTGFGLGIIVVGATSALDLTTVAVIAAVVSLVTLVNCAVALPGAAKQMDWCAVSAVVLGVLPGIGAGVWLLELLSQSATSLLQGLLGGMIVYSAVNFLLRPAQKTVRSGHPSFVVSGFGSGLTGGLFGMAGPPLIYQFYRQPFELTTIRNMLLISFAFTSATRSLLIGVQGQLSMDIVLLAGIAVPVVMISTILARRFPPPLSAAAMRRMVFGLLMLIGLYLIANALVALF